MRAIGRGFRRLRNQLFKACYAGKGCFCPYCGKSYRKFLHQGVRAEVFKKYAISGAGPMKNVRCPHCRSNHRMRLLYLFFELRTDIFERDVRILHIAPKKDLARFLRTHNNIDHICGALFPERWADFDAVKVDITDIPFPDADFDVLICNHVLEHVPGDETAMAEIFRVIKPGGFAVLQVPLALDLEKTLEDPTIVDEKDRKREYGQKDHVRLYGMDYFDKLTKAGFRVVRDNPFTNEWMPDLDTYCLDKNEDVYVAFKD
jgi:SAM-dependent methyltransferase